MKKKMKTKTKIIIIAISLLLIILLFPLRLRYKDGGSVAYRSIAGIYEVTDWNQKGMASVAEGFETRKTGITVKLFGLTLFDNSKTHLVTEPWESSTIDTFYAIGTENFPVEMTADEMLQKAKEEGFVVTEGSKLTSGSEALQEFMDTTKAGNPAVLYLAHYYTLNKEGVSEEYYEANKEEYPKIFLMSLYFDGEQYIVTDRPGYEAEPEMTRAYPYLVKFEGKPSSASAIFDRYEYYVLVHDKTLTWKEIEWGMLSSQIGDYIDHCTVVSNHIVEE